MLSNLEFERDIVIYNSDDLHIKTENQSALPVQVSSSVSGSDCFYLFLLFPGIRGHFLNNVQIRV